MKIGIVAAIYITNDEHRRLLKQMVASIQSANHALLKIAVINNYLNAEDYEWVVRNFDIVFANNVNCLCRAWNLGIKLALSQDCNYVVVANTDIVFRSDAIDWLVEFAQTQENACAWCPSFYQQDQGVDVSEIEKITPTDFVQDDHYFSCFMVGWDLFEYFGEFDEQFAPIYYEDCDMFYRVSLQGGQMLTTGMSIVWHYGSHSWRTANDAGNPDGEKIFSGSVENYNRYVDKWGGAPGEEKFTVPYNGEAKK